MLLETVCNAVWERAEPSLCEFVKFFLLDKGEQVWMEIIC